MPLTAIDIVREELRKIQVAQNECVTPSGVVKREHKYRYKMLVGLAQEFKNSLDWLEKTYQ